MAKTNTGLVTYVKAQLGKPYWYGTFGNTATASLYTAKKKQYPGYYDRSKYSRGWSQDYGQRVHDCVGLIKGYLWSDTPTSVPKYNGAQDTSANGMLGKCAIRGKIKTIPELPGVLVFMPGHVGVYIGGGYVIEARGHDYGVVKTKLSSRPWTDWGKCPYIAYTAPSAGVKYKVVCTSLRVRKGAGITYGTVRYLSMGATVTVAEVKGTWGRIGQNQWVSLKPAFVKKV